MAVGNSQPLQEVFDLAGDPPGTLPVERRLSGFRQLASQLRVVEEMADGPHDPLIGHEPAQPEMDVAAPTEMNMGGFTRVLGEDQGGGEAGLRINGSQS